ncbi:MAG TPA: nucleotide pyrophosphatase/phosphodiesterase family protein [Gaiella sp.]|jgi:predicted AlkP superfamily pyrophosphatase or phosphodiesterase|nr:nucleotide pyrophosphatase/phosphodiesterase family protein [Gaiella sp.]
MGRKLILVVIDGLTPEVFEQAVERGTASTLASLHAAGSYGRAASTFPSLTPVCMATLATGAHPDVHEIPHLVWYHRGEGRLVEYGSSFGAMRAAGTRRAIRDAIVEMNAHHLSRKATTVFESLEDAGLTAAAVNTPCYRGRTRHIPTVPGLVRPVEGPRRFFYFSLFESDVTGAPLAIRTRTGGSIDAYAAAVGRWLVTRDGFDFLFYYLPDYDYASHALGPGGAEEALRRSDKAVGALVEAAGGLDEFLQRYAVVVCSDHGQTHVDQVARLQDWVGGDGLVTASNRAGMVYTDTPRRIAARLAQEDAVDIALFTEDGAAVALRDGGELLLGADDGGWQGRARHALANPNAGDVLVSAAEGVEFADLGGRHHAGGGSHGSLLEGDSLVPMLVVGAEEPPPNEIAGVAPFVLRHLGIEVPAYARAA